jgi:hypothetical protein
MGFVKKETKYRVQNHRVSRSAKRETSLFFNQLYYCRNIFESYFPKFLNHVKH